MKIRTHLYTSITDGVRNILKIIDSKFLRNNIDDLVAGGNISFVLVGYELVYFTLRNFIVVVLANDIAARLQAFDMMTGNTNIPLTDLGIGVGGIAIL